MKIIKRTKCFLETQIYQKIVIIDEKQLREESIKTLTFALIASIFSLAGVSTSLISLPALWLLYIRLNYATKQHTGNS